MAMGCERLPQLISAWHLSRLIFSAAVRPTAKWKSAAQKQFVNPTKSARKDNPLASFRPELTNDVFVLGPVKPLCTVRDREVIG